MIISEEKAEKVDFLVCCSEDHESFLDNLYGNCSKCKRKIHFRPYVPKKPKKICMKCAEKLGAMEISITPRIAKEVRNYLTKN